MKKEELKLLREEGEGYLVEFKEKTANIDKEMVAFANGSGGKILLGISDNGNIKGIKITNKLKSQIQDIANNCEPAIKIMMEEFDDILVVHVRSGEDKPYSCSQGFYTRIGPNAQKMKRNQIIEYFQSEGKVRFDELINLSFDYKKDFDKDKFEKFLSIAGISKVLKTPAVLCNLGVAEKQEGKTIFNNTGILFFAKNLNACYLHTTVTCALYKGVSKANVLDRKDFNEDIVSNVDHAMLFLKQHIPVRYEFDGSPKRKEIAEVPFGALREAVINAVVHRDYFQKGANVMVEIFDDRIEISSPGGLVKGLLEKDFGKKSVLRNANIANLFQRMGYIEKMGTGIIRMRELMAKAHLQAIDFQFTLFVTAVFKREYKKIKTARKTSVKTSVKIVELLNKESHITIPEMAEKLRKSTRAIEMQINKLKKAGFIKRIGHDKGGHWKVNKIK
ncbi:putative DNA binding domain-containing protein [bacterium]|nr:putative DNA binding domain-containing protein [bacterium]